MHMPKRTIAYVEGNSCRDVYTFLKQRCTLWKGICTCLFCCLYLLFMVVLAETMYLCRTLGELLRMHSGCFCYRNSTVWFWKEQGLVLLQTWNIKNAKKLALTTPPLFFFVWWSKLMKQRTPTACHSHCLPIIVSYKPLLTSIIQILNINLCHINFRSWWTSINHILTIY